MRSRNHEPKERTDSYGTERHRHQRRTRAQPARTSTSPYRATSWSCSRGFPGSGKSSLAFDTMYAEGQRRYVESLSSYARMFLGQMNKPDLDSIDGLSPGRVHRPEDHQQATRAPRWAPPPRSTTTCACCSRAWACRTARNAGGAIKSPDHRPGDRRDPGAGARRHAPSSWRRWWPAARASSRKLFADLQKEGFARVRIDGEIVKLDGEPLDAEQEDQALHRRGG